MYTNNTFASRLGAPPPITKQHTPNNNKTTKPEAKSAKHL